MTTHGLEEGYKAGETSTLPWVTIFQECQPEFLHDLVLKMKAYIFTPGDSICRKGEVAREMFIIADGILEVISETGRVLTTMKAGDFFGEIGILNLDGLNKRTADVRSVGYSELFSLSREDVLAAMKDYPEAQDILQTLGRKRLQEAKNMSRKYAKGESLELQALAGAERTSKDGNVLRRMPRVEKKVSKQRNSTSSMVSMTHPTPSTSSAPDNEPEVIGAGLPLLQRLLLLKAKEEKDKNQLTPTSNLPSSSETISPSSIKSPLSPTIKTLSPIRKSSESSSPGKLQSPTTRTSRKNSSGSSDGTSRPKVSFRDKIFQVHGDGTAVCQPLNKDISEKPAAVVDPTPKTESNLISIPNSVVTKIKSPARAVGSTFRDKLKLLQSGPKDTSAIEKSKPIILEKTSIEITPLPTLETKEGLIISKKPWTTLKKAAILGDSSKLSKDGSKDSEKTCKEEANPEAAVNIVPNVTTAELVRIDNNNVEGGSDLSKDKPKICLTGPLEAVQEKSLDLLTLSPKAPKRIIVKPDSIPTRYPSTSSMLLPRVKKYRSIDDLSPEYGGLPFVKKLKILNERQKLAELEKVVKIRSSSLDCTSSSEDLLGDTLTRSHSEGSTMDKRKFKRKSTDSGCSNESNETLERRTLKSILKKLSEDVTPSESPERSNELKKLCRAPTLEGFAARHSKFAKSVTFHRHTLPSPPASAPADSKSSVFLMPDVRTESIPQISLQTEAEVSEAVCPFHTTRSLEDISPALGTNDIKPELALQTNNKDPTHDLKSLRPEEIKVPSEKPKLTLISAVANQRKLLRGSLEEQEYFGEVLLGIKQVIQGHLHDVQGKFQERFNSMENEVRKRDEIISQLQKRIQELERLGLSGISQSTQPSDTVFATSPPTASIEEEGKEERLEETFTINKTLSTDDLTDEKLSELTGGIELAKLSYPELQSLAESLSSRTDKTSSSREEWTVSKSKRLDLNLDGKAGTYSRKRAAKLRQRKSWEDQNDQESMEMHDLTRPLSPHTISEDRSLLSPELSSLRTSRRSMPFHFFGSHLDTTKSKIKKTLSVDTGMHHTGRNERKPGRPRQHRKFSLGSFFGYKQGVHHKPTNSCNEVESDPQREDSPDEFSNIEDSNSSSTTHLLSQSVSDPSQRSLETSFTEGLSGREARQHRVGSVGEPARPESSLRQSRGLILRAASLDRASSSAAQARRFGSLKSASTDSDKRL
ncbi:Cyclic-nucleotide-gated cation channel [Operophtera brumata]|uniref:Cyclic-nucleotide-gated cation channel n=1 Tax=Operophtera brumata TaxID=104452 RepID=A0A0L7KPC3_OPEBR|nr:Cyclic-nucleotide-gated cation channel [Operophtera brumata]